MNRRVVSATAILAFILAGCVEQERRELAANAAFSEVANQHITPSILDECLVASKSKPQPTHLPEQKGPFKPSAPATEWIKRRPDLFNERPKPSRGGSLLVIVAPASFKNLFGSTIRSHIGCSYELVDSKLYLLEGLTPTDFYDASGGNEFRNFPDDWRGL